MSECCCESVSSEEYTMTLRCNPRDTDQLRNLLSAKYLTDLVPVLVTFSDENTRYGT